MGMRGSPSADKAGLACHKAEVILAAYPPRLGEQEHAFVDPLSIPTPPIPSEGSALMLLACFLHEGNCTGSQMRHHVGNDTRLASCCPVYSAQHLDVLFPAIVE